MNRGVLLNSRCLGWVYNRVHNEDTRLLLRSYLGLPRALARAPL